MGGQLIKYIYGTEDNQEIQKNTTKDEDIVNPWEVKAESITGVDYDKLIGELNELIVWIYDTYHTSIIFVINVFAVHQD
jgi:hypothetical protein